MFEIKELFSGIKGPSSNYAKSFAFSVHKAGSSLMASLLRSYCLATNFPTIDIPETLFNQGVLEKDWHTLPEILDVIVDGYLYLGFRSLPDILNPDSQSLLLDPRPYKICLLVRDPRDCLVSQYFSMGRQQASSHAIPKMNPESFLESLKSQGNQSIDDYVLTHSHVLFNKLKAYLSILEGNPNIKVFRYEDIYFDKHQFLINMLEWFSIPIDKSVALKMADKHDIRPAIEDVSSHIRKGEPGDHKNKLLPVTVAKISDQFRDLMKHYRYEL